MSDAPLSVLERTDTAPVMAPTDNGDHDLFAHYVRKNDILTSALTGVPVVALCGKEWVPGRDPLKFPVCPDCKKVIAGLPPGEPPERNS